MQLTKIYKPKKLIFKMPSRKDIIVIYHYNMATNYIQVNANTPIYKFECPSDAKAVILNTIENQIYDQQNIF